jgi:hypothetical protein
MGLQHPNCSGGNIACNFCPEEAFPPFDDHYHHVVKGIPLHLDSILSDMHTFRKVIEKLASKWSDA